MRPAASNLVMSEKVNKVKESISTAIYSAQGDTQKFLVTKLTADKDKTPKKKYLMELDILLKQLQCYQQVGKALKKKLGHGSWRVFYKSLYVMHLISQSHTEFLTYLSTCTWNHESDFNDRGGHFQAVECANFARAYYNYLSRYFQVAAKMVPMKNTQNFRNLNSAETIEELFTTLCETEEKLLIVLNMQFNNPIISECYFNLILDISMLFASHSFLAELMTEYFSHYNRKSIQSLYSLAQRFHKVQNELAKKQRSKNVHSLSGPREDIKPQSLYDFNTFIEKLRATSSGKNLPKIQLESTFVDSKIEGSKKSHNYVSSEKNTNEMDSEVGNDPFHVSSSSRSHTDVRQQVQNDPFGFMINNAPSANSNDMFNPTSRSNPSGAMYQTTNPPSSQSSSNMYYGAPSTPHSPSNVFQTHQQSLNSANSGFDLFNNPSQTSNMSGFPTTQYGATLYQQPSGFGQSSHNIQPPASNSFSAFSSSGFTMNNPDSIISTKDRPNKDIFDVSNEQAVNSMVKSDVSNNSPMKFPNELRNSNPSFGSSNVSDSQGFGNFAQFSSSTFPSDTGFGSVNNPNNFSFGTAPPTQPNSFGVASGIVGGGQTSFTSASQPKKTTNPFDDDD